MYIYSVDMFVSQSWIESRFDMSQNIFEEDDDYVILPSEFFDNLWQPDPYFLNSKVSGKHSKKPYLACYLKYKLLHINIFFRDCNFEPQVFAGHIIPE